MSRTRSRRADFEHFFPLEVRWADMDALGHVNNSTFLTYSESARIAYFDALFKDDESFMKTQGLILAEASCSYHQQVFYPAKLMVGLGFERVGNSSIAARCPIFREGEDRAVADVRTVLVWFDYRNQKPMTVPQRLRDAARELSIGD